jgi:hypothetical protein
MRSIIALTLLLGAMVLNSTSVVAEPALGVGVKIPLQLYAALGITERITFEMGVPLAMGPHASLAAVAQLKVWVLPLDIAGFETKPYIGLGGRVAVETQAAETLIRLRFHAIGGIDFLIPNTSFTILSEVWAMTGEQIGLAYYIGVRYDF